jgi:hypothetical protein
MRLKDVFTFCLASLAAAVPWTARGKSLADPRYQRRQEAAEILRNAVRASEDVALTEVDILERYRSAVSRAIQVVGPDSHAADEMTRAVREADGSVPRSDATLQLLGDRIEEICERLAFAPIMEAEMPAGFPPPTPVREVEVKQYPAYRMAWTQTEASPAFLTLFNHIKREKIAMTAPVEMSYDSTEAGDPIQRSMAFLYGSRGLGETGSDGSVRVVDIPPQTVVSIGVRGDRTPQKIETARGRLMEWIDANSARYRPEGDMRLMGYNSPFVPSSRRYFEVQIPITTIQTRCKDREIECYPTVGQPKSSGFEV